MFSNYFQSFEMGRPRNVAPSLARTAHFTSPRVVLVTQVSQVGARVSTFVSVNNRRQWRNIRRISSVPSDFCDPCPSFGSFCFRLFRPHASSYLVIRRCGGLSLTCRFRFRNPPPTSQPQVTTLSAAALVFCFDFLSLLVVGRPGTGVDLQLP